MVDRIRQGTLHYAAKRDRQYRASEHDQAQADIVALLLRSRACLESVDQNGSTPLMIAVTVGDEHATRTLLKAKANLQATDSDGQTVMDLAVSFENKELIKLLKSDEWLANGSTEPTKRAGGDQRAAQGSDDDDQVEHFQPGGSDLEGTDSKSDESVEVCTEKVEKKKRKKEKKDGQNGVIVEEAVETKVEEGDVVSAEKVEKKKSKK